MGPPSASMGKLGLPHCRRPPVESSAFRTTAYAHTLPVVEAFLASLGFVKIGEVVDQHIVYSPTAATLAGERGAVYVIINPGGRVWKVGMTRQGFSRVDYTRVFNGRAMKRPHEQRKLESIRREVHEGATQWVLQTEEPKLVETLLTCLLEPTESSRQVSKAERTLRR